MDNKNSRPSTGFYITMLMLVILGLAIYYFSLPQ